MKKNHGCFFCIFIEVYLSKYLYQKYLYLRLTVCVFPVMVVTTALPLARTSAFSYLASTITLPFKVMIPQCLGICSKAQ